MPRGHGDGHVTDINLRTRIRLIEIDGWNSQIPAVHRIGRAQQRWRANPGGTGAGMAHCLPSEDVAADFEHFRRLSMVLKQVSVAIVCTVLLTSSGSVMADEYRPDEYFGLDLSRAVLSPRPLGPATEFAPVALEAKTDRDSEGAQATDEPKAVVHEVKVAHRAQPSKPKALSKKAESKKAEPKMALRKTRIAHPRLAKARSPVRTRLAQSHGNPLDAQAFDTRIQVWPCRSGGICNWKR
jgi:hypothetical protein